METSFILWLEACSSEQRIKDRPLLVQIYCYCCVLAIFYELFLVFFVLLYLYPLFCYQLFFWRYRVIQQKKKNISKAQLSRRDLIKQTSHLLNNEVLRKLRDVWCIYNYRCFLWLLVCTLHCVLFTFRLDFVDSSKGCY